MSQQKATNDAIRDVTAGKAPANNPNWTAQERQTYNAVYNQNKNSTK
ncbi:hypothetical protein [Stratiformator vulcanicus]|uniref:Uncharacterized protein n=1 Tax=Stratiformator vulcanicus TaxID=2527980 RepID=A0A517R1D4_9PLAN|nr:hypothetical protein [Stratiformator vulcanicus]QDT37691.1 hypothetical protein Pan189_20730 [Stratiformator vulcanicus]